MRKIFPKPNTLEVATWMSGDNDWWCRELILSLSPREWSVVEASPCFLQLLYLLEDLGTEGTQLLRQEIEGRHDGHSGVATTPTEKNPQLHPTG